MPLVTSNKYKKITKQTICYLVLFISSYMTSINATASFPYQIKIIPPSRGLIYDRHGNLLVKNISTYTLFIQPQKICCKQPNSLAQCTIKLIRLIRRQTLVSEYALWNFWGSFNINPNEPIALVTHIPKEHMQKIQTAFPQHPAITTMPSSKRQYIYSNSLSHILGYVRTPGRRIKASWTKEEKENYQGTIYVGARSIEKQYEKILHGQTGQILQSNSTNKQKVSKYIIVPTIPGNDLYLTIDLQLQSLAEKLLGKKAGAVVAMDPNNGEILVLVSKPGYDANQFTDGIFKNQFQSLKNNQQKPLLARA